MNACPLQVLVNFCHILTDVQIVDTQHISKYTRFCIFCNRQLSYLDSAVACCYNLPIPFAIHNLLISRITLVVVSNIPLIYDSQILVLYMFDCCCCCCCRSPFSFIFSSFSSLSFLLPSLLSFWILRPHRWLQLCWDSSPQPDRQLVLLFLFFACISCRRPASYLYYISQKNINYYLWLVKVSLIQGLVV